MLWCEHDKFWLLRRVDSLNGYAGPVAEGSLNAWAGVPAVIIVPCQKVSVDKDFVRDFQRYIDVGFRKLDSAGLHVASYFSTDPHRETGRVVRRVVCFIRQINSCGHIFCW